MRRGRRAKVEKIASKALERLETLIGALESAAEMAACGQACLDQELMIDRIKIRITRGEDGLAVCSTWSYDEYLEIIEASAREAGTSLERESLSVNHPAIEFEENMITGRFEAWKGICVEIEEDLMEDLLSRIEEDLASRSISLGLQGEEELTFLLPVSRRRASTPKDYR